MNTLEQVYLIMFGICLIIVIIADIKCRRNAGAPYKFEAPPKPPTPSKFKKGDVIEEIGVPVRNIKKVTGFYVTDTGVSMTTLVTIESYGQKVEQRNQSSVPYCTVVVNTYYKKINYIE